MTLQPPGSWAARPGPRVGNETWQWWGREALRGAAGALPCSPSGARLSHSRWSQRRLQDPGRSATRGRHRAGLYDFTVMVSYSPASRRRKQTLKSPPALPDGCSGRLRAPGYGQRAQHRGLHGIQKCLFLAEKFQGSLNTPLTLRS